MALPIVNPLHLNGDDQVEAQLDGEVADMANTVTRVAFLGPPGTYTHQALLQDYPEDKGFVHVAIRTIEEIFLEIHTGACALGIVPFENSTNGVVTFTLDLLSEVPSKFPNVNICGETFVDVHHNLTGYSTNQAFDDEASGTATPTHNAPAPRRPRTEPLVDISHIKRIYSHPQAWGQCHSFLSAYFKGIERIDCSSTSKAAEIAAADDSKSTAAISSLAAAQVHNLDILAKGIEDRPDNQTRFLTIRRGRGPVHSPLPAYLQPGSQGGSWRQTAQPWKSMLAFRVEHGKPGALAQALDVFARCEINLTALNSRPSQMPGRNWTYLFFVEFYGSNGDGKVRQALSRLGEGGGVELCWLLGSFRDRS